jgi:hypothetical protein
MEELHRRLKAPEAEVWVRLRRPTLLEMVGRELESPEPVEPSEEFLKMCEWIADRHHEATWDWGSAHLRDAARQLVEMVAPVIEDPEEVAERVQAWAEEWTLR